MSFGKCGGRGSDTLRIRYVEQECIRFPASLHHRFDGLSYCAQVSPCSDNVKSATGQLPRDLDADPTIGTGHQNHFFSDGHNLPSLLKTQGNLHNRLCTNVQITVVLVHAAEMRSWRHLRGKRLTYLFTSCGTKEPIVMSTHPLT